MTLWFASTSIFRQSVYQCTDRCPNSSAECGLPVPRFFRHFVCHVLSSFLLPGYNPMRLTGIKEPTNQQIVLKSPSECGQCLCLPSVMYSVPSRCPDRLECGQYLCLPSVMYTVPSRCPDRLQSVASTSVFRLLCTQCLLVVLIVLSVASTSVFRLLCTQCLLVVLIVFREWPVPRTFVSLLCCVLNFFLLSWSSQFRVWFNASTSIFCQSVCHILNALFLS